MNTHLGKRPLGSVKITHNLIGNEDQFQSTVVVCFVMGANPLVIVIEGFIKRIWKDLSVNKVGMISKVVFLVRFQNENDRDVASDISGILFDKKPFVVKP